MIIVFLGALALVLSSSCASHVNFQANTGGLHEKLTRQLELTCSIRDNGNNDVNLIASITISQGEGSEVVASLTSSDYATTLNESGEIEIKGYLSKSSGQGLLQVTKFNPREVDIGQYHCHVTMVGVKGQTFVLISTLNLTSRLPSLDDVIKVFDERLKEQQKLMAQQQETIKTQQEQISKLSIDLQRGKQLSSKQRSSKHSRSVKRTTRSTTKLNKQTYISHLQNLILNQSSELSLLKKQVNFQASEISKIQKTKSGQIGFHAEMSTRRFTKNKLLAPANHTLMFDNVTINQGEGFNSSSGHFSCKISGLYVFYQHVQGAGGCFYLMKNEEYVTSLLDFTHAVNHVVELRIGDVVRVMNTCDVGVDVYQNRKPGKDFWVNYFIGYLIAETNN